MRWVEEITESAQLALLSALNPVFFSVRQSLRIARKGYSERASHVPQPCADLDAVLETPRAKELIDGYALSALRPKLNRRSFALQCQFLDLIDHLAQVSAYLPTNHTHVRLLDIGSKNFQYAPALYSAFSTSTQRTAGKTAITGIEIDAHRVYRDFHSRLDYGRYYLSILPGAQSHMFIAGDLLHHTGKYEVITWFHPFLDVYPLLFWGLPRATLKPKAMFEKMLTLLAPNGVVLISNQTEGEYHAQAELLTASGLSFESFELDLTLWGEGKRRYAHVATAM